MSMNLRCKAWFQRAPAFVTLPTYQPGPIDGTVDRTVGIAGESDGSPYVALLRVRLGPSDARYANGLVAGAKAMELFGDLETELALLEGGDEGLCASYDSVEFLARLHVGDFVEARARVVARGNTSRRVEAELYKVLGTDVDGRAVTYPEPVLAVRASATIVVGRGPGPRSRLVTGSAAVSGGA